MNFIEEHLYQLMADKLMTGELSPSDLTDHEWNYLYNQSEKLQEILTTK